MGVCMHYALRDMYPCGSVGLYISVCRYRIAQNFRGAQFSWIGVFKNFAETIFADRGFRYSTDTAF